MGIIGSFEGYVDNPLYLYNYGAFGGGQTGVTCYGNSHLNSGDIYIKDSVRDGNQRVRFNNIVPTEGYNFLNINGWGEDNDQWNWVTVELYRPKGNVFLYNSTGGVSRAGRLLKFDISKINESCFLYVGSSANGQKISSTVHVQQVYFSNT